MCLTEGENLEHQPSDSIIHLQFGGDQLTAERARNSKKAVIKHMTGYKHSYHMQRTFTVR